MPKPDEKLFEKHFCHQLEVKGNFKGYIDSKITVDKDLCLHLELLEDFLSATQQENFIKIKEELDADWREDLKKKISHELKTKPLFQIIKDGLVINNIPLDLVYFKPQTDNNPEQQKLYSKNIFSYIRQYHFGSFKNTRDKEDERQSIDIVLCLNGFAIVTVELKNNLTSGTVEDAINQYLSRDLSRPIFQLPFLHIVCDNEKVKVAASFSSPPSKDDFRDFNKDIVNKPLNKNEYPVHYLYHEILLPDSLLNFIESYLYGFSPRPLESLSASGGGQGVRDWIFPRYHQQRCVRKIFDDIIKQYKKTNHLNLRYLVHHSAGSGKSNTIVWLVQNLRELHVNNKKLFDSIIVLTHRTNLDDQISKDFRNAIGQVGVVAYCEKTNQLKRALERNSTVIVSILHKFNYLKELVDQSKKKICLIIDEAHTSQEGKLHEKLVDTFEGKKLKVEEIELIDEQEELVNEIARKEFPNLAFIALTATPSDNTLEHFGIKRIKDWEAFDTYSMDQAITEGYIMDVVKNVINYETLYELTYHYKSDNEYPPLPIYRALKLKAFEDDELIQEKCKIIIEIFKDRTADKIYGRAKSMIVTSSRLSAVKYKLFLDEQLKKRNLPWKSLVAFTGTVNYNNLDYTESSLNKSNNPLNMKIEDNFHKNDKIRFLIVANKFQVGFDESLLHTMFLDKAVSDRNAVQTISRLNRIHPGKVDTLTIDFTNSYDDIIKAFKKYQNNVTSSKDVDPQDLFKLKEELLKRGVFTKEDIIEIIHLFESEKTSDGAALNGKLSALKSLYNDKLDKDKKREFRTLLSRYIGLFNYIRALFTIPQKELYDFQLFATLLYNKIEPIMNSEALEKEIQNVKLKTYAINKLSEKIDVVSTSGAPQYEGKQSGSIVSVKAMATVEEVVAAINLRFREKVSEEGIQIIDTYVQSVVNNERIRNTIKNNIQQDSKQLYDLVIKSMMDEYYSNYIIDNSPHLYASLTKDEVQNYINYTTFKMMQETLRTNI